MLRQYALLTSGGGSYNTEDGGAFIPYVGNFGYKRVNQKNLSDYEVFENNAEFKITIFTIDAEDPTSFRHAQLNSYESTNILPIYLLLLNPDK